MSLFEKNNDVLIRTNHIPINILKNHLLTFPNNIPNYFKNIPSKFLDSKGRFIRTQRTLKTCSGFVNLFKRSILYTSPFDIELFIDDGEIKGSVGHSNWNNYIQSHPNWQFIEYTQSDWAMVLKFMPFCTIQSPFNLMISNPWWHMNNFETIPGIINCKDPLDLNIFIPIKKNQNHLYISQGTPLAYINFETDKQLNLKFSDKEYKFSDWMGLHYLFSNFKRKLTKNIIKKIY
ncbi:MAG: hypothetical protein VW646_07200 [Hydrogenophilales bacterium]